MKYLFSLLALLFLVSAARSQDFPAPPNPPRLVNDFANLFAPAQAQSLEQQLVALNDSTTVQIAVVTLPTLNGYEASDYATRLFEQWKIGNAQTNNGILVLIKPKTPTERGQAYIVTGYGIEGVVPDATANTIVDNEMIPLFRQNQYFAGAQAAITILSRLVNKEFTAAAYAKKHQKKANNSGKLALFAMLAVFILSLFGRRGGHKHISAGGSSLPFWLAMGALNSLSSSRGSWGDFSSGSGSFGGFGGGGTGGGGAGGSW